MSQYSIGKSLTMFLGLGKICNCAKMIVKDAAFFLANDVNRTIQFLCMFQKIPKVRDNLGILASQGEWAVFDKQGI